MQIKTTKMWLGLAAILIGTGAAGCASHSQGSAGTVPARTIPQLGAEMEQNDVMSQSDYIRQNALAQAVRQTHTITEADLTWILEQLHDEKNSVARARAFNTLAEIRPMSAAHKSRILPAIAPYLSGGDRLDQLGAQRVRRAAEAGG